MGSSKGWDQIKEHREHGEFDFQPTFIPAVTEHDEDLSMQPCTDHLAPPPPPQKSPSKYLIKAFFAIVYK